VDSVLVVHVRERITEKLEDVDGADHGAILARLEVDETTVSDDIGVCSAEGHAQPEHGVYVDDLPAVEVACVLEDDAQQVREVGSRLFGRLRGANHAVEALRDTSGRVRKAGRGRINRADAVVLFETGAYQGTIGRPSEGRAVRLAATQLPLEFAECQIASFRPLQSQLGRTGTSKVRTTEHPAQRRKGEFCGQTNQASFSSVGWRHRRTTSVTPPQDQVGLFAHRFRYA
jgi:hypothetical protein